MKLCMRSNLWYRPSSNSTTFLQQGISEPLFYGDLVYKLKRIDGKPYFSDYQT